MATKRDRNDCVDTLYRLFNTLIGRVGELEFDLPAQKKFQGIVKRLSRLYVLKVTAVQIYSRGYAILAVAPEALPSRKVVERRYRAYYGAEADDIDFADPETLLRCAQRLRDISDFIKDVEQSFTNWLNRVQCHGERQGTSWQSRFGSKICGSAPGLFAAAPILRSDGGHEMSRMHAGAPGQVPSVLRRLPELGPALAVAAEFAGRIGIALCFSMASRTLLPLRDALREC